MSDMNRNMEGREAKEILDSILADYELDRTIDKMEDFYDQPNKEVIIDIIEKVYDEREMALYACTPLFKIVATKNKGEILWN